MRILVIEVTSTLPGTNIEAWDAKTNGVPRKTGFYHELQ